MARVITDTITPGRTIWCRVELTFVEYSIPLHFTGTGYNAG